jgi:hypothetical protein
MKLLTTLITALSTWLMSLVSATMGRGLPSLRTWVMWDFDFRTWSLVTTAATAAIVLMLSFIIVFYFLIDNWTPGIGFWENVFTAEIHLLQSRISYLGVVAGAAVVTCVAVICFILPRAKRRERRGHRG